MLLRGSLFTAILPFFRFPRKEESCSVRKYFDVSSNPTPMLSLLLLLMLLSLFIHQKTSKNLKVSTYSQSIIIFAVLWIWISKKNSFSLYTERVLLKYPNIHKIYIYFLFEYLQFSYIHHILSGFRRHNSASPNPGGQMADHSAARNHLLKHK